MEKNEILNKYKKIEEKLLISKLFDKIKLVEKQNKIQYTDFLTLVEINLLKKVLEMINYKNYIIYGGIEEAQRNIIIIFPKKLENIVEQSKFDYNTILNCIRITNNSESLEHKFILGGLIKLGLKREKIGDIIVYENGADIIVCNEISKFLLSNLQQLTRFKKCNIEIVNLNEIVRKKQEYKEIKIIVSSLRLDNIVSELAKTSRSKADEILKQERVLVNYEEVSKSTKIIKENDIITIRGIGKFIVNKIVGNTRSGRFIIIMNKYV